MTPRERQRAAKQGAVAACAVALADIADYEGIRIAATRAKRNGLPGLCRAMRAVADAEEAANVAHNRASRAIDRLIGRRP